MIDPKHRRVQRVRCISEKIGKLNDTEKKLGGGWWWQISFQSTESGTASSFAGSLSSAIGKESSSVSAAISIPVDARKRKDSEEYMSNSFGGE